jgi:O-antigen ligase
MRATIDDFGRRSPLPPRLPVGYGGRPTVARASSSTSDRVSAFEAGFVVVSAFVFGTGTLQILSGQAQGGLGESASPVSGTPAWVQLTFLAIYACALMLLVLRVRLTRVAMAAAPLMVLIAVFPFISLLWSVSSDETLRRGVALFGTCLFGLYLGSRFELKDLARLLAVAYALIGLVSLATVFLAPAVGIHVGGPWDGAWRGLFGHKNGMGGTAAFGIVMLIYGLSASRGRVRILLVLGLLAMMILLAKALSTTALIALSVSLVVLTWSRLSQLAPGIGAAAATVGVLVTLLALLLALEAGEAELWAQFGKSADLSGRMPLWALAWESVGRAPFLGYGYEAFWVVGASDVKRIEQLLHYYPFYSHNSIIETMLSGGAVLLSLVVLAYIGIALRGLTLLVLDRTQFVSSLPLVFTVFFAMINITESTVLQRNDLFWVTFCAMAFMAGRLVRFRRALA